MRHPVLFSALIFLALLLPACAKTPPPAPATKVVYQQVVKETMRPCPATIPAKPAPLSRPLPSSSARLVDLLTAKLHEWAGKGGYGDRADAALKTCTKE